MTKPKTRRNPSSLLTFTLLEFVLVSLLQILGSRLGVSAQRFDVGATIDTSNTNGTANAATPDEHYTVSSLFQTTGEIKIGPGVVAAAAMVVGVGMCVAGYRLFRASVFVCGFLVGGVAISRAIENVFKNESYLVAASWISFFAGGILVGCILMSLYYAGIFIVGGACGVLLAITLNAGVRHKIYASNPNSVLLALAIILGLVGGMAAVCLEKPALIIITSFVGAGLVVWGVGYFAGDFPSGDFLKSFRADTGDSGWFSSIPSAWWGYFVGLLVLTGLGIVIQRRKTGRDGFYDSKNGFVKHSAPLRRFHQHYRRGGYGDVQTPSPRRNHRRRSREERRRRYEGSYIV